MDDTNEITHLLQEIRDLLKADLEMTKEFRKAALARQQASDEATRMAREEGRRFREQMNEQITKQVHEAVKSPWAFLAFVGTLLLLAACAIYVVVSSSWVR